MSHGGNRQPVSLGFAGAEQGLEWEEDPRTRPLLGEQEDDDEGYVAFQQDREEEETRGSRFRWPTFKESVALGVSSLSVLFNAISLGVASSWFIRITSIIGMSTAPLATVQQVRKTKQQTLRDALNDIREDYNDLKVENNALHNEITILEGTVAELNEYESALASLAAQQNSSLDTIMGLLKESKEISKAQREILHADVLETMMKLVMDSLELSEGRGLDDTGTENLILGLKTIESLDFHEDRFRAKLSRRGSLRDVWPIVKNLADPDTEETDEIFTTSEWKLPASKRRASESKRRLSAIRSGPLPQARRSTVAVTPLLPVSEEDWD